MADETTPEVKSSPARKILLFVVLALVAVGGGGAAAYTQRDQLGLGAPPSAEADVPREFGAFLEMEGVVINPRGSSGQRFLMIKVGVEAKDEKTLERLGELSPAARDAVLTLLAAQTVPELSDVTRRDSLKSEIRSSFNRILGKDGPITEIYFTQFVLQ